MLPGNPAAVSSPGLRLLVGLETGILGGLAMFGWLALIARLLHRPLWVAPNIAGSIFYGRAALERGFSWSSVSGLALLLFTSGSLGALFGLLVGDARNRLRVALLGILTGLLWYYFSQALFWNALGVLANLYVSPRSLLLAHLLYGFVLGWFPAVLRRARRVPAPLPAPVDTPQ